VSAKIQVIVNGEACEVPTGCGVAELLSQLDLPGDRVAIEHNLEILPRSRWTATVLQPGDRFEIVHLVGGG
jgi:thiamine biosynthesis protein ThiS